MSQSSPARFVPLHKLVEEFLGRGREAFIEAFPDALLVIDDVGVGSEEAHFHTINSRPEDQNGGPRADRESVEAAVGKILRHLSGSSTKWVLPLENRERKFACILTVGRAANNNVRLNVPSLSKFHAYFTHVAREGTWYLSDANSSNGTFLDGEELPPSHGKVPLKNGAFIRFGPDVTCQFFEAAAFWDLFQSAADEAPVEAGQPGDGRPDEPGVGERKP